MTKPLRRFVGKFAGFAGILVLLGPTILAGAQERPAVVPYAAIATRGTSYEGPGRAASHDLGGPTIHIGLLAPLHGPNKAEGHAIVAAAQMALADESHTRLPGHLRLALALGDESGPSWGRVADAAIHLVFDDQVVAIITSANGPTAHISEQVGNRIGIPVLTLSTDPTTTQTDVPWIFRLGPSDVFQAQVIAEEVYQVHNFQRVLLVAERDHDGRVGGQEFMEAARRLGAPPAASLFISPLQPDANSLLAVMEAKSPQAVVLWTRPENTRRLLKAIREAGVHASVYLSQEAAQEGSGVKCVAQTAGDEKDASGLGIYTVGLSRAGTSSRESFVGRYRRATGEFPSPVAAEAYDAVRLIASAVREASPNRARVRDWISSVQGLAGVSGNISFDDQGNNRTNASLVRVQ